MRPDLPRIALVICNVKFELSDWVAGDETVEKEEKCASHRRNSIANAFSITSTPEQLNLTNQLVKLGEVPSLSLGVARLAREDAELLHLARYPFHAQLLIYRGGGDASLFVVQDPPYDRQVAAQAAIKLHQDQLLVLILHVVVLVQQISQRVAEADPLFL